MPAFDVLVVGAGPVGAAFALALAQVPAGAGLRIGLVEAVEPPALADTPVLEPRALAVSSRSRRFLAGLGAWPEALDRRACAYHTMEVWDRLSSGHVRFDCAEIHPPRLGDLVGQPALAAALIEALRAQPGVELLCPAAVTAIARLPGGGFGVELGERRIETRLLIAADGPDSGVRTHFEIATDRWDPDQQALVAVLDTELDHGHCARQWFAPSGPLAFLPLAGDGHQVAIVWSQDRERADRLGALAPGQLARELGIASEGVLGDLSLAGERRLIPLRQHHASSYWLRGLALLGDAAHVVHPLAGQGVNLGLADAEVLAGELGAALAAGEDLTDPEPLRRYQRRRRPENLAMLAAMRGFKALFAETRLPVALLRAVGMAAFDRADPLKRWVMRMAGGA
jgi:2-octaprenylphenol hydroxylase